MKTARVEKSRREFWGSPRNRRLLLLVKWQKSLGGRDSLSIGAAKPQEVLHAMQNPSCACGTPIAELSGPPAGGDRQGCDSSWNRGVSWTEGRKTTRMYHGKTRWFCQEGRRHIGMERVLQAGRGGDRLLGQIIARLDGFVVGKHVHDHGGEH